MMWMYILVFCFSAFAENKKSSDKAAKWDVNNPPGKKIVLPINTAEGTWLSLDVSPNGKQIVFDLLGDIYLLPIKGGKVKALTSGMAWDMQPRFSPDGSMIAFTSDRGGGDNIWLMSATGKEPKAVSKESFRLVNSPVWTPDGQFIAGRKHFTARRSLGAGEIWLYSIHGGTGFQLTKKQSEQKDVGEPAFSVDGKILYYSRDVSSGRTFQYNKDPNQGIYAIEQLHRQTGEIKRVVGGAGGAIRPTPSPDGQSLAFIRRVRGKTVLLVRHLASGVERQISDVLDHDLQETWAIHGVYPQIAWLPNGQEIVYWAKGKIWRVHVETLVNREIPFQVEDTREVRPALRFPVKVSGPNFDVKMIRGGRVSPDGTKVVYQALGQLWLTDLATGKRRRLTKEKQRFEFDPSWSFDGKKIIYAAWNDVELGSIMIVSARGGKGKKIRLPKGHYRQPVLTPDGKKVAYRRGGGGWIRSPLWSSDPGIYLADIRSGKTEKILNGGSFLHFTNTGDRLYFNQYMSGSLVLRSLRLSNRQIQDHAASKMGNALSLSPDEKWLALREEHNAYLMSFPASGRKVQVSPTSKAMPMRKLSTNAGQDIHFSTNSKRVHWLHGPTVYSFPVSALQSTKKKPWKRSLGFSQATDDHQRIAAIVGARIVTMSKQKVIEKGTVVWQGKRILAVGPQASTKVPAQATVFAGNGLTVLPGLIDVHFHGSQGSGGIVPQQNWINLSALSFGVTTVHDPSNNTEMVFSASELQKQGKILAPRIYSTGTILYGAKSAGATAKVNSLADALGHLRRMKSVGAISVKSYNQPRRDQRQQVVTAGRKTQVMVVPEGGSLMMHNLTQIVDGHTGVEHALPVAPLYSDVLQLWAGTKVAYTPTLGVAYGGLMGEHYWYAHTDVWKDQRLLSFVPQRIVDAASRRAKKVPDEEYHHITIAKSVKSLRDKGVRVQIGAHGQREGLAAHWEMWMFAQGGMTPLEALRAATLDGAKYLGLDGDIGSVTAGKLADFAIVEGNPVKTLQDAKQVKWTVLNGRLYDAANMNQQFPQKIERPPLYFQQSGPQPTGEEHQHCGCSP